MAGGGIEWFTTPVFTRTGLADLPAHLQQEYGITVPAVTGLDVGMDQVSRADGPDWVARVFQRPGSCPHPRLTPSRCRPGRSGFPAERCAAEPPVSVLDGTVSARGA